MAISQVCKESPLAVDKVHPSRLQDTTRNIILREGKAKFSKGVMHSKYDHAQILPTLFTRIICSHKYRT